MKKYIAILLICIGVINTNAQGYYWGESAGGTKSDNGRSVTSDSNGNVISVGEFTSSSINFGTIILNNTVAAATSTDAFIVKHDSIGNVMWAKKAGGTSYDLAYSVCVDASDNILVTGYFYSPTITFDAFTLTNGGVANVFIVKYDPLGNVLWAKRGASTSAFGYKVDTDIAGNVIVAGGFTGATLIFGTDTLFNSSTAEDVFIVKYNAIGNVIWVRGAKGNNSDRASALSTDQFGNIYVTGTYSSPTLIFGLDTITNTIAGDIFTVKYNSSGNVLWAKSAGGPSSEVPENIAVDTAGYVYVIGQFQGLSVTFESTTLFNANTSSIIADIFLAKYDFLGNLVWAKRYGDLYTDMGMSIAVNNSGDLFITGYFNNTSITFGSITINQVGSFTNFIAKLDDSGNGIWAKRLYCSEATGMGIAVDDYGNILATGSFKYDSLFLATVIGVDTMIGHGSTLNDIYIVKLGNANGVVWPGDTNNDSTVTNDDLLQIGLYYGQSGPNRLLVSNTWQADTCALWGTDNIFGLDYNTSDCNGDGIIDNNDTLAINLNFSLTHTFVPINLNDARAINPNLYFTTSSSSYNAGDWVDVEVWAGNSFTPVDNLYGIAFNINYESSLIQPGTESITYPTSFVGTTGTNTISIAKIDALANTAYAGITRINHTNADGYGKIADFKFQTNTTITSSSFLNLSFSYYRANDSLGGIKLFNTINDSILVNPISMSIPNTNVISQVSISPNPFSLETLISFSTEQKNTTIKITDVLGKEVKTINFTGKQLAIEKGEMQNGIYFVKIIDENKKSTIKKIIVQ